MCFDQKPCGLGEAGSVVKQATLGKGGRLIHTDHFWSFYLLTFTFPVGTLAARPELTIMTDQSELRRDKRDDKFYTSWIIRGGVVLALIVAVLAFISTGSYPDPDLPQITTTVPASVF